MLNASVHHQEFIPTRIENVIFLMQLISSKKQKTPTDARCHHEKINIYEGSGEGLNGAGKDHKAFCGVGLALHPDCHSGYKNPYKCKNSEL